MVPGGALPSPILSRPAPATNDLSIITDAVCALLVSGGFRWLHLYVVCCLRLVSDVLLAANFEWLGLVAHS